MAWRLYRLVMKIAHRYNWHYAPVIGPLSPPSEDGRNYQRWCQWCGFRESFDPHWKEKSLAKLNSYKERNNA